MIIFIARESHPGETRVPIIPPTVQKLVKLGADVHVESGMGQSLGLTDEAYATAGANITMLSDGLAGADIVVRLRKPPLDTIAQLKTGAIHISYLDPFNEHEVIKALAAKSVSAISLEMIPRTTIAQKMDVLSSQANLAGYQAVITAAAHLQKILPMMMTPGGTISPSRVLIIGVGVAGLQAIATAKRLGAAVDAYDTRPVVEEQVKSLGAKFVKVDLGETGQTKDGYAKALTEEQLKKQRDALANSIANADIVITTAQLFGKKAPVIVTKDMVARMKPGSVIVDMAVDTGGNVEGSVPNQDVNVNGVHILGRGNLQGGVSVHASQMFSNNVYNLIEQFWDKETKAFKLDFGNEILKGCVITHGGRIIHDQIAAVIGPRGETP